MQSSSASSNARMTPTEAERALNSSEDEKQLHAMDGGIKAWCTVAGSWLALAATFGYTNAFGVYQDFYTRSSAASASRTSWIGSTQVFFLTSFGLPAGKLLDLGYFRQTIFVGSLIYIFSLFMLSLAHPNKYYQVFLSQGVGMGIGSGLIYVPSMAIISHHWQRRRPLAMGIIFTGSAVGGIIFPIMLNQLLKNGVGFAWSVRASAFVVLVFLIFANLLMSTRSEHAVSADHPAPKLGFMILLTDPPYVILIFGALFCLWGVFFPYFYVQLFAILHGVDPNVAFYTLAILNASSIPGRIVTSAFVNTYGVFNILLLCGFCCAIIIFSLFGIHSVAGIIIFSILAGFFAGAFLSLLALATASLSRHGSEVGIRMGFAFAMAAFGSLTGQPIDGALLGSSFSWNKTLIFSGVAIIGGTLTLGVSRFLIVKRKGTQLV